MASTAEVMQDQAVTYWERYEAALDESQKQAARNQIAEHYLELVHQCAARMAKRLPSSVDIGDLRSQGVFGLFDAIEKFDHSREVTFATYARHKINSALMDYLRAIDRAPRQLRKRIRTINEAQEAFLQHQGRSATDEELADHIGMTTEKLHQVLHHARSTSTVRIDQLTDESDDSQPAITLADPTAPSPAERVEQATMRDWLTSELSRAERLIVMLYYYENLSMREIGQTLDLSESRVSQMHSSILARLRAKHESNEDLLARLMSA